MAYWGKFIGGMAGFAMGGPVGAVVGVALGHAADSSGGARLPFPFSTISDSIFGQAKVASMLGNKEQLFSIGVVVLAAKLAKCDGPVKRDEIETFRRQFRIPEANVRDIGRLFDQARATAEGFEPFAERLGETFADNRATLELVLGSLFAIARADGPVNFKEQTYLATVHRAFGLDRVAWDRASGAAPPRANTPDEDDPYDILGVPRSTPGEEVRAVWKRLMRENHPDTLAARGVPAEFIQKATASVARINAAWDRIKRDRGL